MSESFPPPPPTTLDFASILELDKHTSSENLDDDGDEDFWDDDDDDDNDDDNNNPSHPTKRTRSSSTTTTLDTMTTTTTHHPQFHFSAHKAGMTSQSSARLQQVLAKQQNSAYYLKAARMESAILRRVADMKVIASRLTTSDLSIATIHTNTVVNTLETGRVFTNVIVVLDFDQFFAAVEMRDNPTLRDVPLAVGETLVTTANYEARKFGVRSAMPTFIARQLCPQLLVLPARMEMYREVAIQAREIFAEYDPDYISHSYDEAYLDLTAKLGSQNLTTSAGIQAAELLVKEIRTRLQERTNGLTISAGIATNSMLAKIAADVNKPNGQYVVRADDIIDFVRKLPVRKIPGIGKAQEVLLEALGVTTVQHLWDQRLVLNRVCSKLQFEFYMRVALGISSHNEAMPFATSTSSGGDERKSISTERTFRATSDVTYLQNKLRELCESLAEQIRAKTCSGHVLSMKYTTAEFNTHTKTITCARRIGGPSCKGIDLLYELEILLRGLFPIKLRLLGVRLSGLDEEDDATTTAGTARQTVLDKYWNVSTNNSAMTPIPNTMPLTCPICSHVIFVPNNAGLNAHVDACLNKDVVKDLLVTEQQLKARSDPPLPRGIDKFILKTTRR